MGWWLGAYRRPRIPGAWKGENGCVVRGPRDIHRERDRHTYEGSFQLAAPGYPANRNSNSPLVPFPPFPLAFLSPLVRSHSRLPVDLSHLLLVKQAMPAVPVAGHKNFPTL